jgi:hypothetical protein
MRWVRCVTYMRQKRCAYEILIGRREGKRPHGKSKCRWGFDIQINLQQYGMKL